ncbi:MAG: alpha/beta fold hydrolase [Anaerolineae bacterium]
MSRRSPLYDRALGHWRVPYEVTLHIPAGMAIRSSSAAASDAHRSILRMGRARARRSGLKMWRRTVVYRVYAVDLIGEAGKSAPNRPAWDSPAFAEWLEDVFAALHIARAVLVGISQGGWTALKFATAHPERIDKLVLLTPGGVVPDKLSFLLRAIPFSMMGKAGSRRMARLVYGSQPIPAGVEEVMDVVTSNFKARIGTLPIFTDEELRRLTIADAPADRRGRRAARCGENQRAARQPAAKSHSRDHSTSGARAARHDAVHSAVSCRELN